MRKYKCKYCGEIVKLTQRTVHARRHHPSVPYGKMDIFAESDFITVLEDESVRVLETSKPNESKSSDKRQIKSVSSETNNEVSANNPDTSNSPKVADNKESAPKPSIKSIPPKRKLSYKDILDITVRQGKSSSSEQDSSGLMNYKPSNVPYQPKSSQPKDLFEYAVKRIANKFQTEPDILEPKTHQEWMNICFDRRYISTTQREENMSRIKATYSEYFKKGAGRKYTFDFEKIARDYPYFFAFGKDKKPQLQGLDGMIEAMKIELSLSKQPDKREKYKVSEIETIDREKNLYSLKIELDDSKNISFNESLNAALRIKDSWYDCECIDFDEDEALLYVATPRPIVGREGILYIDTTFILEKIWERLKNVKNNALLPSQPINKFLNDTTRNLTVVDKHFRNPFPDILNNMDESQKNAIASILRYDLSFVWGPPGTGKSFTLAGLINILDRKEETTLVCCISNVAVDQLLNKVIDKIEELKYKPFNCEFMRAGYTTDSRLLATDYLFPKDSASDNLRRRIRDINDKLSLFPKRKKTKEQIEKELLLKEERIKLRDELKKRTERIVDKSRIVFSTMAYYVLSAQLESKRFDNLIVDEASMLSMPYLVALSSKVFKRIILVGDPNQLGPISLSPEDMLSKSVFDRCNVLDETNVHPALSRLLVQRRSHSCIVNLTNDFFYGGKLKAVIDESPDWVVKEPFANKVIKVINKDIEEDEVKMIGTSRRNFGTHGEVMKILDAYYKAYRKKRQKFSIGIITPFRAQVGMYKAAIRDRMKDDGFWESIKVGTVHTFQGSECDMIIFDIVEKYPEKVSKLFNAKEGERLVNVALSRARHKLIVVGDTTRFRGGLGLATVSPKTCKVLGRITDVNA